MYIQENLTTTPYEIPNISWELPDELLPKFRQYGGFSKLVFNEDKTRLVDIIEDADKRAQYEEMRAQREAEEAAKEQERETRAAQAALQNLGVRMMARRMFAQSAAEMTCDEVIQCRALAEEWTPGVHQAGEVRTVDGYPYKCRQAHDTEVYPDIVPDGAAWAAFWIPYHGTSPETALPFVRPTGAQDMYQAGEYMIFDGTIYRCMEDTAYSPTDYPSAWERIT